MSKNVEAKKSGYFPFEYYESFLKYIFHNKDHIEVITYNDIEWCDDYDHENAYKDEWENWNKKLARGEISKEKIYLLIQHDVDKSPALTTQAIEYEKKYGLKSNIMLFNKRVNRKHLQQTGEVVFDEGYISEIEAWKKYEKDGFVFCYHANSYEQANFDREKARNIFENDIKILKKIFNINFFSPHGGARCPAGLSNASLQIPESLQNDIRWVANGATVKFNGVFSDGGPNLKTIDPNKRDLKDFVASWKPGKRYRIITHPQYYVTPCSISPRLLEAKWYGEMLASYANQSNDYWDNVGLNFNEENVSKYKKIKIRLNHLSFLKNIWK
jgi:hypothetical protein